MLSLEVTPYPTPLLHLFGVNDTSGVWRSDRPSTCMARVVTMLQASMQQFRLYPGGRHGGCGRRRRQGCGTVLRPQHPRAEDPLRRAERQPRRPTVTYHCSLEPRTRTSTVTRRQRLLAGGLRGAPPRGPPPLSGRLLSPPFRCGTHRPGRSDPSVRDDVAAAQLSAHGPLCAGARAATAGLCQGGPAAVI